MAFSFSVLSNDLTQIRGAANTLNGLFASIKTARTNLLDQLESNAVVTLLGPAELILTKAMTSLEASLAELIDLSRRRILDRVRTLEELPGIHDETSIEQALRAIYDATVDLAATTPKNTVTLGAITKTVTNSTAGNLTLTKKLPGNIAAGPGKVSHVALFDIDSELPDSDAVYVTYEPSLSAFRVSGRPAPNVAYGSDSTFGNAGSITVDATGSGNLISNFFETFTTTNEPDDWTIVAGAAGTEILEDSTVVMTGSKSLKLEGTAEIKYPIADLTGIAPRQMLSLSVWLKKDAGTTSGTYKLQLKGTGMSTQETAAFNATDLSSSAWTEKVLHLKIPAAIPSDLAVHIVTSAVDTSDGIFLDGGTLIPYTYWAGIGFAISPGPGAFVEGDRFVFAITNDYAGAVQTWMARAHGFQLPSA